MSSVLGGSSARKDRLVVFAGAGASKAVSPDRFPTTVEFFDALPKEITSDPFFSNVVQFLREDSGAGETIDIEQVLWQLKELLDFVEEGVSAKTSFPGWMFAGSRLQQSTGHNASINLGNFAQLCVTAKDKVGRLIGKINEQVYRLYKYQPTKKDLENNWIPLLDGLSQLSLPIDIVTTNYDLVLETALRYVDIADPGWQEGVSREVSPTLWTSSERKRGILTKLHGSINWQTDDGRVYIAGPMFTGNHASHAIIYPGFKGRPEGETFNALHAYFRRAIKQAAAVIFIGFAFRDEYINEICERDLDPDSSVVVINPKKVEVPLRNPYYIESPFGAPAVKKALDYLRLPA